MLEVYTILITLEICKFHILAPSYTTEVRQDEAGIQNSQISHIYKHDQIVFEGVSF